MEVAFGIFDHLERRDVPLDQLYEERLQLIEAADRAGIFCYHLAEHHATPLGMSPSPSVFLAAVAMRTRKIHMGPLVYLLPLYHPMRLVEEICMLDQLSGGRLEVGVGRGVSPYELAYFNVNFLESRAIFEESLKVIVEGLRDRKITHRGDRYKFTGAPIELAPKQKPNPPFWYGASTPDGLALAARHRMQIVTGGPNAIVRGTLQAYRSLLETFRDHPDNLNPQIKEPKMGAVRHFFVADSDKQAEEIAIPAYRSVLQQHRETVARFRHGSDAVYRRSHACAIGRRGDRRISEVRARKDCDLLQRKRIQLPGAVVCVGQPELRAVTPFARSVRVRSASAFREATRPLTSGLTRAHADPRIPRGCLVRSFNRKFIQH